MLAESRLSVVSLTDREPSLSRDEANFLDLAFRSPILTRSVFPGEAHCVPRVVEHSAGQGRGTGCCTERRRNLRDNPDLGLSLPGGVSEGGTMDYHSDTDSSPLHFDRTNVGLDLPTIQWMCLIAVHSLLSSCDQRRSCCCDSMLPMNPDQIGHCLRVGLQHSFLIHLHSGQRSNISGVEYPYYR